MKIILLAVLTAGAVFAQDEPELKFAVIVSRHGVRAPTWTPERLNEYSAAPWPDFKVPPGYLTPHGFNLISSLGRYYGAWLREQKLLSDAGCGDATRVFIWADTDQRTRETGRAYAESLLPGCRIDVHALGPDERDPLFDAISGGLSTPDPAKASAAMRERLGDPAALLEREQGAFETLQMVLSGSSETKRRVLDPGATIRMQQGAKGADLAGPLNVASTLTENLLLEYTNGFTGSQLGWGRLTEANLLQILTLHGDYARLTRETPYIAGKRGWNLASHVLESLRQAVSGQSSTAALGPADNKLLIITGHDTNLSNLAGMLGLEWHADGYQKNETPPGGALLFLLLRDKSGAYQVRLRFVAQTLAQMHEAADGTTVADVKVPGCASNGCDWAKFDASVTAAITKSKN